MAARVILDLFAAAGVTDSTGILRAVPVSRGAHVVEIRRLGYRPDTVGVEFAGDSTTTFAIALHRVAIALTPVNVNATRVDARPSDFDRRRARGGGFFFARAQLDSNPGSTLADILRRKTVARFVRGPGGNEVFLATLAPLDIKSGGICFSQVILDGVRIFTPPGPPGDPYPPDLSQFVASNMDAVEFYPDPAMTPVEFATGGAQCGTLVLWSRGGHP
ncbi:MAG: hypothetical protein ACYCVL_13145 [Gemmatimonadaceae bacterium]